MTNAIRFGLALMLLGVGGRAAYAQPSVRTPSGPVRGTRDDGVAVYKGIPYAAPPVGELRWKPPQPAPHWDEVRDATKFGPPCPQPVFPPGRPPVAWSEDCLTINVWTPVTTSGRRLPVLVVIPGGGFFSGGSDEPAIDGTELATRGIVVVSFNYRLGVFGFFAHPALSKESPNGVSGNYGLMDQIAALRWVRHNIEAFGGDPRSVTISGSSAGGSSVLYLLVAPQARGLFARAIAQSAALVYGPLGALRARRYGREPREADGVRMGTDLAALRALSANELLARSTTRTDLMFADGFDYWPNVDGAVLPDEPWALFESGRFAHVPLIIGTNADEGTVFVLGLPIKTAQAWREHLGRRHPGAEAEVQAEYAASDSGVRDAAARWVNDWYFHGSTRAVARAVSAHGVPVFVYNFSRVPPGRPRSLGAFHSAEIAYVFGNGFVYGNGRKGFPAPFEEADRALGHAMSGAWVQFTRTGDPNGPELPVWPRYDRSTDQHMDFGSEIRVGSGLHARTLDVYDRAFAAMRRANGSP
jgi:para-nitrobenzyl esterase